MEGHPEFHKILTELASLHAAKQRDYGTDADPFANIRDAQDFGVKPWLGAFIRMNDKVRRLKEFAKKGSLMNESVEDSLMDLVSYAIIALVLFREEAKTSTS